uniref:Mitochondrial import inner membrane translocase subunit TIM50 n=1 Tax=Palpitomonas bilix TaxID=652834 RepID=A0A7S3GGE2_9EUKA|mmetsp:Transcript_47953/g.124496  ORF Transcript_47953/g.124496 Transcript_47953/m.124496 type:complete len:345 (+) Transcript_47953:1108-2142(+)
MFRRLLSSSFRSVAKSVSPSQGVRGNGLLKQRSARFYQAEAPKRTPEEIAKRTNRTFLVVFGGGSLLSLGYVGAVAANITQAPGVTEEEAEQMEPMERVSKIWKFAHDLVFEPYKEKLLPDFQEFLFGGGPVPQDFNAPPTLVLDLDETMVHTEWSRSRGHRTMKRQNLDAFLQHISQMYEVVVYAPVINTYGEAVVNQLEGIEMPDPFNPNPPPVNPKNYITHRLYRESTKYEDGVYKKDISRLNRDLRKVIVIDDSDKESEMAKDNRILVKPFTGGRDSTFMELVPILEHLHQVAMRGGDVRVALKEMELEGKEDLRGAFRDYMKKKKAAAKPAAGGFLKFN